VEERKMRIPIVTILAVLSLLCVSQVAISQDGYTRPDPVPLTLSDGTVLQVTYGTYGDVDIRSDNFTINFNMINDPVVIITINNSYPAYAEGEGIRMVSNGFNSRPSDEVVDIGILPTEYRGLWSTLLTVCGEIVDNDGFWEIAKDMGDDDKARLTETLELMRDGYYAPEMNNWFLQCQSFIGGWENNRTCRGYRLEGPVNFKISTPSPWGDENPELFLEISERLAKDRWSIFIDPAAELCTISWESDEFVPGPDKEDWAPYIDKFRTGIEFFLGRVSSLIESGVLEPDNEFEFMLNKALDAINTYDFVLATPENRQAPTRF
jgi:hypothetical protein